MLNKSSGVPLHNQLTDLIRSQVLSKKLHPEDRLPSERALCEKYGISRITVRQAIGALVREGLLFSVAGKGTFVSNSTLNAEWRPPSSFTQDFEQLGRETRKVFIDAGILPADDTWVKKLGIPFGSEMVYFNCLYFVDEFPIAIKYTHLPHLLCQDLFKYDLLKLSLQDVLRNEYGLCLAHSETMIEAALASPEEARLLKLDLPSALLISEQTTYLDSGVTIEVTRSIFNGQRYRLNFHV